ncbi:hypothetical protein EYF80_040938 [Liparis tanakae]|uniref:Uncharacterized protein n=1 Tax=Liparis tanakae TaxID=230148 RepID=A0A4Z2G8E7_9TELE|nr:hypothetical protein EYF80_040938 [Liparis tanakae]
MLKSTAHPGGEQRYLPQVALKTTPLLHSLLKSRTHGFHLTGDTSLYNVYLLQVVLCCGQVRGQLGPAALQLGELSSQPRTISIPQVEQLSGFPGYRRPLD